MKKDILDEFSKEELIRLIREKGLLLRVSRHDLLFIRWSMQSKRLQGDYQAELDRWDAEKPDFKQRDILVAKFNASTNVDERIRLAKQIAPYDSALREHLELCKALDKRQEKIDRLYQQMKTEQPCASKK